MTYDPAPMDKSFYVSTGDGSFVATELTRGPWDPGARHAGPPSALLGREIEAMEGSDDFQVGRIVFEILRPVPIGPVTVETRATRIGTSSFVLEHRLTACEPGGTPRLVAVSDSVMVRYDYTTEGAIPIDEPLVSAMEAFEGRSLRRP